ncbi:hypothetical protein Tco_0154281, partial [Tanacetum coccineum]
MVTALGIKYTDHFPLLLEVSQVDFVPPIILIPQCLAFGKLSHRVEQKEVASLRWRAKCKWALEGNENAKFFHNIINGRRWKQNIHGVQSNESWVIEPNDIKRVFFAHFSCQFREPSYSRPEFFALIWECVEDKALGPDGMTFKFVKHFWDIVGVDFINVVEHFVTSASLTKGCNPSFISLIPKGAYPTTPKEYRPISLIGCQYKFVDDVLFVGWLGIGSLKAANLALLSCWWWRIRSDKSALWNSVIVSIHGYLGGTNTHDYESTNNSCWKSIVKAGMEIHNMGFHFFEAFSRKECCLSDRCGSDDDNFQWIWDWRQPIQSGREMAEFDELMELLCNFRHGTREDSWNFLLSNSNLFYVKSVRVAIDKCGLLLTGRPTRWSSLIPLKVLIFVWRAKRNRIPTRVELDLKEFRRISLIGFRSCASRSQIGASQSRQST